MTALGSPTGRSTRYDDTALPTGPGSVVSGSCTLTGTTARIDAPGRTGSPRLCSQVRSAPAMVASTTSLTLPPKADLILRWSASDVSTVVNRRCAPVRTDSGDAAAGRT